MKNRVLKIISIIILIALFLIAVGFAVRALLRREMGFDYMDKEEIIEIFDKNFYAFDDVKTKFESIDKMILIESDSEQTIVRDDWVYDKLSNGLTAVSYFDAACSSDELNMIENSECFVILSELDFDKIDNREEYIFFENRSNLSFSIGIAYLKRGNVPQYMDVIDMEQLDENWYYIKWT